VPKKTNAPRPRGLPESFHVAGPSPTDRQSLKVLVLSHSHPQLTKGGGEVAAYELFSELSRRPGYEAWLLGCTRDQKYPKLGATLSQPFSQHEYLYTCGSFDWFKFSNTDPNFPREFRALLAKLRPQIVHFHHYINVGVEAFLHVREVLPDAKIILTLHEFLAVCHHFGQMVTKQHRTLCYQATPLRCSGCFPELTPSDFFLRSQYIQRFFELVDRFIAPSRFLAERYVNWGVPREKMSVIENVLPGTCGQFGELMNYQGGPLRVGFFGQLSILKGVEVLMDAADLLDRHTDSRVVFEIYGDYSGQPSELQSQFLSRLQRAGRNVIFHGPYEQSRVDYLMQSVDLVLMPSVWWENSPVVIQEALRNHRPVICSNIGGMAEKVRHGVDGFHFPVGNAPALAALLRTLSEHPQRIEAIKKSMTVGTNREEIILQHEKLYAGCLTQN
jgi:glycosyltransferase involved in cell wall biosynthesis